MMPGITRPAYIPQYEVGDACRRLFIRVLVPRRIVIGAMRGTCGDKGLAYCLAPLLARDPEFGR